jgi:hypothetical protein
VAGHVKKREGSLTVSLDESLELLEVNFLFGTSSTHCLLICVLFSVVCASLPSDLLY